MALRWPLLARPPEAIKKRLPFTSSSFRAKIQVKAERRSAPLWPGHLAVALASLTGIRRELKAGRLFVEE
jgi:hypothetical protein